LNGGTQYIPVGQGFFVKTNDAVDGGNISIPKDARVHNDQTFWKEPKSIEYIKLSVKDNNSSDETIIVFNSKSTDQFDDKYDAFKQFSRSEYVPQIYTVNFDSDIDLAINTFNFNTKNKRIPFAYKFASQGEYTVNINNLLNEDIFISVWDNYSSDYLMKRNKSEFVINADNFVVEDRLELVIEKNVAPVINSVLENKTIYTGEEFSFTLPEDFYIDENEVDSITLSATKIDGEPLPEWLIFNNQTRTFSGVSDKEQYLPVRVTVTDYFGQKTSSDFIIEAKNATSISELEQNTVMVFPLPAKDYIFLNVRGVKTNYNVSISSISGALLFESNLNNDNVNKIDVSSLTSGVYIMTILFEDNSRIVKKIVK